VRRRPPYERSARTAITTLCDFLTGRDETGREIYRAIANADELSKLERELLRSIERECERLVVRAATLAKKLKEVRRNGYEVIRDYRG
jgi:hypothetical protein